MKDFNVPKIILIGFNRAEMLISNYKHLREFYTGIIDLYVDGAREGNINDAEEQEKIKEFFEETKNDTRLTVNISYKNRGCKDGVIHAITSGFNDAEFCVIVEDDCFIEENFLLLCEHFHKKQKEKLVISSQCRFKNGLALQYYQNPSIQVWGWACSKDVWRDFKILTTSEIEYFWAKEFKGNFFEKWNNHRRCLSAYRIDTWDYIFKTYLYKNGINVISFNKSFVDNRGFDSGTHGTKKSHIKVSKSPIDIFNLKQNQKLKQKHYFKDYWSLKAMFVAIFQYIIFKFKKPKII